jgi:FkbM family methyltransferase
LIDNLIFDLGFYNGDDTAYYLFKGYNVVAIEANPELYNKGLERFRKEIEEEKLFLLNLAFNENTDAATKFFVNTKKPYLSTGDSLKYPYWEDEPTIVEVSSINYTSLISTFDTPYYIKCDIEGLDFLLIKQISKLPSKYRPEYLSFELSRFDYFKTFSYLYVAGYTKFQLINQTALGKDSEYEFSKYSSGKFGKFLPEDKWLTFDECLTRYMKYKELKGIDNVNLALGWIDIHAKL